MLTFFILLELLSHFSFIFSICRENICHIVKAPANVSWKTLKLATDVAYKAVSSLEGAGVFAVELFLTADGQVGFCFICIRYFIVTQASFFLITVDEYILYFFASIVV